MGYSPPDYDAVADFAATGSVICDDCGTRVRPRTVESLPPHRCTERQRHHEQTRMLDAGQPPAARKWQR